MGSIIPPRKIESIAVIGAGPGGLAAAKYLLAEKVFPSIVIFEQRNTVGGVWNATPNETGLTSNFTVPRTKPTQEPNQPIGIEKQPDGTFAFQFPSPVYDDLDTNIARVFMGYSDFSFPEDCSIFPRHEVVLQYLKSYAEDINDHIQLGSQVLELIPITGQWLVTWKAVIDPAEPRYYKSQLFDAVVVANGHYDDPFVPDIPGIKGFEKLHPGSITHSKFYRRPTEYVQKKIIVVGHSASGLDISNQISPFCISPLLVSVKDGSPIPPDTDTSIKFVPEIRRFLPESRAVQFSDDQIEENIDTVIFCTGYMYSFPFITKMPGPPVITNGARTLNLFEQLFYRPNPTLSFIATPQRIIPFPLAEAQGAVVARVLSGRLSLPSEEEMLAWEEQRVAEKGDGKSFNILGYPADAKYINNLHDWALQATKNPQLYGGDGVGKKPPYWGERECWIRENTPAIKEAARRLGKDRGKVKTLEELGFDYEAWKEDQLRRDSIL